MTVNSSLINRLDTTHFIAIKAKRADLDANTIWLARWDRFVMGVDAS